MADWVNEFENNESIKKDPKETEIKQEISYQSQLNELNSYPIMQQQYGVSFNNNLLQKRQEKYSVNNNNNNNNVGQLSNNFNTTNNTVQIYTIANNNINQQFLTNNNITDLNFDINNSGNDFFENFFKNSS